MNKRKVGLIFGIVLAGAGFVAWKTNAYEKFTDTSFGAIPACEETLIANLKSPSSYSRISAKFLPTPALTPELYRQYEFTKGCAVGFGLGTDNCIDTQAGMLRIMMDSAALDTNGDPLKGQKRKDAIQAEWETKYAREMNMFGKGGAAMVVIEYDADNTFGTAIREKYICSFGRKSLDSFDASDIYLPDADIDRFSDI